MIGGESIASGFGATVLMLNGAEAKKIVSEGRILEVKVPRMYGTEVLRFLREIIPFPMEGRESGSDYVVRLMSRDLFPKQAFMQAMILVNSKIVLGHVAKMYGQVLEEISDTAEDGEVMSAVAQRFEGFTRFEYDWRTCAIGSDN